MTKFMSNVENIFKRVVGFDPRRCEPKMPHDHIVKRIESERKGMNSLIIAALNQIGDIGHIEVIEHGVCGQEPYTLVKRTDGKCAFIFGLSTDGRDVDLHTLVNSRDWFD